MQNKRMPPGERAQRLKGWRVTELTDTQNKEEEHEVDENTRAR